MALVMLVLAGVGWYVIRDNNYTINIDTSDPLSQIFTRNGIESTTYKNEDLNISFSYRLAPDGYVAVTPETLPDGALLAMSLFKEKEYLEMLESAVAREAPPAITLEIFPAGRFATLNEWIKGSKFSNFNLSDGKLLAATVGGLDGFTYYWSGLYEGQSSIIKRGDNVYIFSVQYLTPNDKIITDFNELIGTVKFLDPATAE